MEMNDLIRAAAGRAPVEQPPPADDRKRAGWGKADGGEGRGLPPPIEAGMSSLIRAQRDEVAARARTYEQLAEGRTLSARELG
jgi:hypothetical protein